MKSEHETRLNAVMNDGCFVHAAATEMAKHLLAGQANIYEDSLLERPLTLAGVRHMLLDRWGTTPRLKLGYGSSHIAGRSNGSPVRL